MIIHLEFTIIPEEMKFLMHLYDTTLIERYLKPLHISQIIVLVMFVFVRIAQLDTWF